uniref:Uncharacterized protein n=1 Tax=Brassica campestris TaxID=3711 RepID=A0A3P6C0Z1_BRACM|nr:unnamed protein product [Brassica rapa]
MHCRVTVLELQRARPRSRQLFKRRNLPLVWQNRTPSKRLHEPGFSCRRLEALQQLLQTGASRRRLHKRQGLQELQDFRSHSS